MGLLRLNGTSSSWPPLLPPLPCNTLAQAFLLQALSPAWPLDPLPKPSGTSNSWQLLLLLAGRREVCPSPEPLASSPDLLLRLSGTSSSWPPLPPPLPCRGPVVPATVGSYCCCW